MEGKWQQEAGGREGGAGSAGERGERNTVVDRPTTPAKPPSWLQPHPPPPGGAACFPSLLQIPGTEQLAEQVRKESTAPREKEVPCPRSKLWKVIIQAVFPEIV